MKRKNEILETAGWDSDGIPLDMSPEKLGKFLHHLLRLGGSVESTWVMDPADPVSFVHVVVLLPLGRKEQLERDSGFTLHPPSQGPAPEYMVRIEAARSRADGRSYDA